MTDGADSQRPPDQRPLDAIPLFPLPNVVLFPGAILPLHIFEQRYREMTADVLRGDRRIAMALLKPGWEKDYYRHPPIEPVVCVGTILEAEKLPDGKYNFLLRGHTRARVVGECHDASYRVARLEPLVDRPVLEIDLLHERHQLLEIFGSLGGDFPLVRQFRKILSSPLPTAAVADLLAFNFLEDVSLKQSLLVETDVRSRVARVVAAMEGVRRVHEVSMQRVHAHPGLN